MKPSDYLKVILIFFFFIGCTSENNYTSEFLENIAGLEDLTVHKLDLENVSRISLNKEVVFEELEEVLWGRIIWEVKSDEQGTVFIVDMASNKIHVYKSDGTFKVSVGREGRGPGEFNEIRRLLIDDHHLHVFDITHSRVSIFDINSLKHVRDINVALNQGKEDKPTWVDEMKNMGFLYRTSDFAIHSNDTYLIFFKPIQGAGSTNAGQTVETSLFSIKEEKFIQHNINSFKSDGTALFLDRYDGGGVFSDVVYKPRAKISYAQKKFIYGWSEKLLFKIYNSNGIYQSSFFYPFQNAKLYVEDLFVLYLNPDESMKNILQKYAPEFWPAYDNMVIDDQYRLWISTIVDDFEMREWLVVDLNNSGKLLGKFRLSRNIKISQIKNGYIYTIEQDFVIGLKKVVRYSFNYK